MKKIITNVFTKIKEKLNILIKNIKKNIKVLFPKIKKEVKLFFSNKTNIIISLIVLVVIIVIIVFSIINANKKKQFILNHIYDMYPEEIRNLYANIVDVSCGGDMRFDVPQDKGEIAVEELNKKDLLDYLFSNLDKNENLNGKISHSLINKTGKKLFDAKLDLFDEIKDYQYGDYIYNIKGNKIIRKANKCVSTNNYVSFLYGYSWDANNLSIDVNVGYLKDDVLYDLNDNNIGKYSLDMRELIEVFANSPYYRLNYIKNNGLFKLQSVSLISKSS